MSSQVDGQPAYLIHRKDYRESSLLIELFTPEYGRLGLVAKGARSTKSEKKGLLQLFQPLLVWWRGRSDLKTLTGVESSGHFPMLKANALASAFYFNELLMKLTERLDPNLQLFNEYHNAIVSLAALDSAGSQYSIELQAIVRYFEIELIQAIGYGLNLESQGDNDKALQADSEYLYYPDYGAVLCASQDRVNEAAIALQGRTLIALRQRCLLDPRYDLGTQKEMLKQAKLLTRNILNRLLGGQMLHSRSLLQ